MNFNFSVTNVKNLFPTSFLEGLRQQPSKMGYAACYLLEAGRTVFQFVCGSIKHRINQGSFSLDPTFRKQMVAQFNQARTCAAQAGVAGFLGLFTLTAVAVVVIAKMIQKKDGTQLNPPPSNGPSTASTRAKEPFSAAAYFAWLTATGQKDKDSPFKLLCQEDPVAATTFINDNKIKPEAPLANQMLQDILDGILKDMFSKKEQKKNEELNKNRLLLLDAYFTRCPTTDLRFLGQQLAALASPMVDISEQDRLPFFLMILDRSPDGLKHHLKGALNNSIKWNYRIFLEKVIDRNPSLKSEFDKNLTGILYKNLKLVEWILTEHRDWVSEQGISGVLTHLIRQYGVKKETAHHELFQKVVQQNPNLPELSASNVLSFAAIDKNWEMFKIAAEGFKNVTREKVVTSIRDQPDLLPWFNEHFPKREHI